eukprot:scaffold2483_cov287-Prasinococcus_capsulatus_cf.AAC.2
MVERALSMREVPGSMPGNSTPTSLRSGPPSTPGGTFLGAFARPRRVRRVLGGTQRQLTPSHIKSPPSSISPPRTRSHIEGKGL